MERELESSSPNLSVILCHKQTTLICVTLALRYMKHMRELLYFFPILAITIIHTCIYWYKVLVRYYYLQHLCNML